jgi:hypothetical protein
MAELPAKAPKKIKEKRQTPEERLEALRYNHMMYGPTEGEQKLTPKKIDYGVSYLKHPKFQSLIKAFKNGTTFKFDINANGKLFSIDTDGSHISFNGKVLCYSRPLNRYEDNLLLDRASAIGFQTNDAVVHLIFAVLRSFPEIDESQLVFQRKAFYHGNETLEVGAEAQGPNLLLGAFKHTKFHERVKN